MSLPSATGKVNNCVCDATNKNFSVYKLYSDIIVASELTGKFSFYINAILIVHETTWKIL